MGSFAHLITRKWVAGLPRPLRHPRRRWASSAWSGQAESPATGTAALPNGTDSRAAAELRDQLPQDEGSAAVVVYSSDRPSRLTSWPSVEERARTLPGVTGAPPVVAEDGTAATVFVPVDDQGCRRDRRRRHRPARRRQGGPPRGAHRPGHRSGGHPGRPRRRLRRRELPPARGHGIRRRDPARHHLPQPVPLARAAHRRRRRRPAGRRARHPHARGLRRALGRVDDRHPVGAGLRCGHRLRAAAHQPLPRRAADHAGPP